MEKQYLPLERERDFSQKINDTFSFVRLNFKDLFLALLFIVGPVLLIAGIAGGFHQINVLNSTASDTPMDANAGVEEILRRFSKSGIDIIGPAYFILLFATVISMVLLVVTVYSYMQCYLEDSVSRITVERVTEKVKIHFLPVFRGFFLVLLVFFGIIILASLATGALGIAVGGVAGPMIIGIFGLVIFAVMIYFMIMFLLSPAIIVFEDASPSFSLRRAKYLIEGKWWSTFGLVMIVSIIVYFIGLVFSLPAGILTLLKILNIQSGITSDWVVVVSTAISMVGSSILSAITYIALGLQYFNLVERKDGNSLFKQINNLGNH